MYVVEWPCHLFGQQQLQILCNLLQPLEGQRHRLYLFPFTDWLQHHILLQGKASQPGWHGNHNEEATETLRHLANQPSQHLDLDFDHFKKDRTTSPDFELLLEESIERISPTQNCTSLAHSASSLSIWTTCTNAQQVLLCPQAFSWDSGVNFMDSSVDQSVQSM